MNLDTSRTFPFSVKDETTGETRTLRAAATAQTPGGEDIIFIATGQAYRRSSHQSLQFVAAPEFDLIDAENLSDAPRSAHAQGDFFPAQVYATSNAAVADIVLVKTVGVGIVEDETGQQYARTMPSMKLIAI